jgi:hypothetical protein
MTLIEDHLVSSPTASIGISVPTGFKHLLLVATGRSDQGSAIPAKLQLNGDTGANYDRGVLLYDGSGGVVGAGTIGDTGITVLDMPPSTAPAGVFGGSFTILPDCSDASAQQMALTLVGRKDAQSAATDLHIGIRAGWWRTTAAVTSVHMVAAAGNIVAGSRFTLYGLR